MRRGSSWKYLAVISTLCLFPLISGCGDSSGDGSPGLTYTGATSPAVITSSNAAGLIGSAYTGGNSGISVGDITAGVKHLDNGVSRRPRSLTISRALIKFVHLTAIDHTLAMPETAATASNIPRSTLNGNCGGTATVDGSYDDADHTISLSANLSSYCQDGMKLNGTIGALGQAIADRQNNINISNVTITLANLSASYEGGTFTASGTMSITPQPEYTYVDNNILLTINMLLKDNATTKVYKLANFRISQSSTIGTISYDDITITGRFYDPDSGYIDLSTPTAIRILNDDVWPSSGSLRAGGADCSATLTALSDITYQLDVDSDGNGSVDSSESGLWANI